MELKEFIQKLEQLNFSLRINEGKLILQAGEEVAEEEIASVSQNEDIIGFIRNHKSRLIEYLSNNENEVTETDKDVSSIYRLTGLQEGMLFHSLYSERASSYVNQLSCDLHAPDVEAIKSSWAYLLKRHTILRSCFYYDAFKLPVQCVFREVQMPFTIIDLRGQSEAEKEIRINDCQYHDRNTPFDLTKPPLMKVTLVRKDDQCFRMIWTFHHIVIDGWSLQVLMKEFFESYKALANGNLLVVEHEDNFEDYLRYLERLDKEKQETFWRNYLTGIERGSLLPFIGSTAIRNKGIGEYREQVLTIEKEVATRINDFAKRNRLTLNTILQGTWAYLLHHYTGSDHVCFGITVSGRPEDLDYTEQRVGTYINTIPLHSVYNEANLITDWLHTMQRAQLQAREHQYTNLSEIQKWAGVKGDFFDSLLVFENYPISEITPAHNPGNLKVTHVTVQQETNYPLTIVVAQAKEGISVVLSYNGLLLAQEYVSRIKSHLSHVLLQLVSKERLGEIVFMQTNERNEILKHFAGVKARYPHQTIIDLFNEQVEKTPDAIAVVYTDKELSYRELNKKANQLAHHLRANGVREDCFVPILMERNEQFIVAIIGILKAGGAYVPIDPDYPFERISYMLEDTEARVVVSARGVMDRLPTSNNYIVVDLDNDRGELSAMPESDVRVSLEPAHAAYIIYTSGSTGKPKGVIVEHQNVVRLFMTDSPLYNFNAQDTWTVFHSFCFDFSVWEMYGALFFGGRLVVVSKAVARDTILFSDLLVTHRVTVLNQTPSSFYALQEHLLDNYRGELSIRYVIFGGEALDPRKLKRWKAANANCRLINMYGITETTVHVTYQEITDQHTESSASVIGRPIPTLSTYILDKTSRLTAIGVPGELFVGGAGVARGYLNKPELTGEKFITDPFADEGGSRMYKTGDLARWLPDGNIEYLGRIDEQVKIRGYRIELGEIESVLSQIGFISHGVVVAKEGSQGKILIAYIVCEGELQKERITTHLKSKLPEYMVPSVFLKVEKIPLTSNGKVDRKSLPAVGLDEILNDSYQAPKNEIEASLVSIWQEVLGLERLGIHDNFFEAGGHSLLATRVISMMRRKLKVEVMIRDLFEYPTVHELALRVINNSVHTSLPRLEVQERGEQIPLSFSQERLWFIDQFGGSVQYHIPSVLRLKGNVDIAALEYALRQIVNRHEVLRTVVEEKNGQPYQRALEQDTWRMTITEDGKSIADKDLSLTVEKLVNAPFDLSKEHPLRAHLVKMSDKENLLVITQHHIASDGWSLPILIDELQTFYESKLAGRPCPLKSLELQYVDYAIWQRKNLSGETLQKKLSYWENKLQGVLPLNLPTDYARGPLTAKRGGAFQFNIPAEVSTQINSLSQAQGTTLFMTLLAAFKILLYRYSGQDDICVGSPIANRPQQELEGMIGFFVNMLALRTDLGGGPSFIEVLERIKETTLDAYNHQEVPFEKVVESIVKERDMNRSPLFQVLFVLQNRSQQKATERNLGGLKITPESIGHFTAKFDLTLSITETAEGLLCGIEYDKDLYSVETITRLAGHYRQLLLSIVQNPNDSIDQLEILSLSEKHLITETFNSSQKEYRNDVTVMDLFEECVSRNPENIAVLFNDESLTYRELNERSNQLGNFLRKIGIKDQMLVPVCIERSVEMIVSILGILKAGAAYVPVDPLYPMERIDYMLKDTRAQVVLTTARGGSFLTQRHGLKVVLIDQEWEPIAVESKNNFSTLRSPENLFYVIYTSGSTGKPKGVGVFQRGVVNLLQWYVREFGINEKDRNVLVPSIGFDLMQKNIFGTLLAGGAVVVPDMEVYDAAIIKKCIARHSATIVNCATSAFIPLVDQHASFHDIRSLRLVIIGAEPTRINNFADWILSENFNCEIVNTYGPTEATDIASFYRLTDPKKYFNTSIPIGQPNDNVQLYIVNKANQLQPIGVIGEIYIAGDGIGAGYWNAHELTSSKFIDNPFDKGKIYKTGDLGYWLADGNMEFVGRADDQVKIRGYRVELGEIETVLNESKFVSQAVASTRVIHGANAIVCYFIHDEEFDQEGIIAYLKGQLPDYMVPSFFMQLKSFPLTPNGKVDRKALPDPDVNMLVKQEYVPPRNETEESIARVWRELLQVKEIGIDNNFFALGGHSLLATRIISAIRVQLQTDLAIRDLFEYPTIRRLAEFLAKRKGAQALPAIGRQEKPERIPLSFSQERLWFIDQLEGSTQYHMPVVLRLRGNVNIGALNAALANIVSRHEILRTVIDQENGSPYQRIMDAGNWRMNVVNRENISEHGELRELIARLINEPFALSADYMFRAALIRVKNEECILIIVMHHIASDGWSWSIITHELAELYDSHQAGRQTVLHEPVIQYSDYSVWQRTYLNEPAAKEKLQYWEQKLKHSEPLNLPTDYPRSATSRNGRIITFTVNKKLTSRIKQFSYQNGSTLFMSLLCAFKVLLYRHTGQTDICVGNSIANRGQLEVEKLVGFFLNAIALRSDLVGNPTFNQLLKQIKETTLDAYEHQDIPFSKVVEAVVKDRDMLVTPLFQVLFELQNNPVVEAGKIRCHLPGLEVSQESYEHTTAKFDITFTIEQNSDSLLGIVEYCSDLFKEDTIQRMIGHYVMLLDAMVTNPELHIDGVNILTEEERKTLLIDFNDTAASYPRDKTISELFEEQVELRPEALAVICDGRKLTFRQLNSFANKLALTVRQHDVGKDCVVAVMADRSVEMMISMLGVWKAGAAILLIDPDLPEDRIIFMLSESNCRLMLTDERSLKSRAFSQVKTIDIAGITKGESVFKNPDKVSDSRNLSYVIFTSGSTGKPKGVQVEHMSKLNHIYAFIRAMDITEKSVIAQTAPASFDILLWQMVTGLIVGGQTVIYSKELQLNVEDFIESLTRDKVSILEVVPSYLSGMVEVLAEKKFPLNLRWLVSTGEELKTRMVEKWFDVCPQIPLVNVYGPTEASDDVTLYKINNVSQDDRIPIGKPIQNTKIYIVNGSLQPCPIGVSGEIAVGGECLSRGYTQPDLNVKRFKPSPFDKGEKLYLTGDVGKWLSDGNIVFAGRNDAQVKIRGHRIELGEIESVLVKHPDVKECVVMVSEEKPGFSKQLVAYVAADINLKPEDLKEYLQKLLPAYMVPVHYVFLRKLPLTPNGKVDRKALPVHGASIQEERTYVAPVTEAERQFVEIWEAVLGRKHIGTTDNFFEIGGDSIMSLQIVSRIKRAGYAIAPKDIFMYHTIRELSELVTTRKQLATPGDDAEVTGKSGLLPIQQWFFEKNFKTQSHFNQTILLGIEKTVNKDRLAEIWKQLVTHHDALRFQYSKNENTIEQEYGSASDVFSWVDISSVSVAALQDTIANFHAEIQQSLNIWEGKSIKAVLLLTTDQEQYNRLLIVAHHLVIDGVSWRILLEDLDILLNKGALAGKTNSYREWYGTLEHYGARKQLLSQTNYWHQISCDQVRLPIDYEYDGVVTMQDMREEFTSLNKDLTDKLLKNVPAVYRTEINDLLLCALSKTISAWTGSQTITVGLEGHGREYSIFNETDISRTVGWFTNLYPVSFKLDPEDNLVDCLRSVKDSLRGIPDKGLGYGILKYINKDSALAGTPPWEIVFNYLGQSDHVVSGSKFLKPVRYAGAKNISDAYPVDEKIVINSILSEGSLKVSWSYSSKHFRQSTIARIAESYIENLSALVLHCIEQKTTENILTPSDLGMAGLINIKELDAFFNHQGRLGLKIESICRLSGLQEGMLFHCLYDRNTRAYTNRFTCDLLNPDIEAFKTSWNRLLDRHTALRSGFCYEHFRLPVQCLYSDVKMPVEILDLRHLKEQLQEEAIREFEEADYKIPFDFNNPPLMRISLLRLSARVYKMIWTFHHIVLDGWSLPVLMQEFLETYDAVVSEKPLANAPLDRYENYIRYLDAKDKEAQESYWRNYLAGSDENSGLLPFINASAERNKGLGEYKIESLQFSEAASLKLESFAKTNRLTLNTVLLGVWAYLLHRYTGNTHVTCGVTVSGRPDDLPGIENAVGMYINTLPFHTALEEGQEEIVPWLQSIQDNELQSRQHQYTTLSDLQKWIGLNVASFDSLFVFENYPVAKVIEGKEWKLAVRNLHVHDQTNYPLTILIKAGQSVNISFSYNAAILEEGYVKMIKDHFERVAMQIVDLAALTISDINPLSEKEIDQLLKGFNDTHVDYEPTTTMALFKRQVEKTPDAIAVQFDDKQLSYRQLNERSNQLAHHLRRRGVTEGTMVCICLDRGIDMIVGLLGILKAGAAYVPIDISYPVDRIIYMIQDTGSPLIITNDHGKHLLSNQVSAQIIDFDVDFEQIARESIRDLEILTSPDSLTYVIYTSGTTGRPKGITMPDRALVNLTLWHNEQLPKTNTGNRVLQFASINFDASFQEIFSALCFGGTVYLIDEVRRKDMGQMLDLINSSQINYLFIPFVVLKNMCAHACEFSIFPKHLTTIFTAGEQLRLDADIQKFSVMTNAKIMNYYGPSETHVVTAYEVQESDYANCPLPPIGKPISNSEIFILGRDMQLCNIGTYGEIYIGGVQVAYGYLNNENLTKEKFLIDPYDKTVERRLYKTGDIGRWLPDGNIEFSGRNDEQVKIRGYRIEPGEVEAVLQQSEYVKNVVVISHRENHGGMRLIGYVVPEGTFDKDKIMSFAKSRLPEYMVPATLIEIEKVPVTIHGKTDRRALPRPEATDLVTTEYADPTNEVEKKLVMIWKNILGVSRIGIHDNFFELGGQSLLAMRVVSAVSREFQLTISIRTFFQLTTIETLARYVVVNQTNQVNDSDDDYDTIKF